LSRVFPCRWTTFDDGTKTTFDPARRARRHQSVSSRNRKKASSSGPIRSISSRRTIMQAPITDSTSRGSEYSCFLLGYFPGARRRRRALVEERRRERREVVERVLLAAVLVHQLRRRHPDVRVGVHVRRERRERVGRQPRVVVQEAGRSGRATRRRPG
jgi:hypothetical protein